MKALAEQIPFAASLAAATYLITHEQVSFALAFYILGLLLHFAAHGENIRRWNLKQKRHETKPD